MAKNPGWTVFAPNLPIPEMLPWVSGRFYGDALGRGATNTDNPVADLVAVPFFVPNAVTITSIGVEVESAAAAGGFARLGIFADDGYSFPGELLVDAGTVATDSTGFKSVALSLFRRPGWIWGAIVSDPTAPTATFRARGNAEGDLVGHGWSPAASDSISGGIIIQGLQAGTGPGPAARPFPERFWNAGITSNGHGLHATGSSPRILLGV